MPSVSIPDNLAAVRNTIAVAAEDAGRAEEEVTLIAVSKRQPVEALEAALNAGHRTFGENRAQELLTRWPALRERYPDAELHFIGHLQSNKVREVLPLCAAIHTLDRLSLARKLADGMEATGHRPDCFIQVNTGEESQKGGIPPQETDAFIASCLHDYGLPVTGLMCLPPKGAMPAPHFAWLRTLAERHGLLHLSMGMSHDFATAVRLGATHIRVGTAVFGARDEAKA